MTAKRKLIEVALPLEAINRASAREKSIRHGHPSTLHLWWARRPLAAARAILFAQLVDDPSSNPADFPTEEDQRVERERLHKLIERLVVWENTRDKALFDEAREEILKSTNGNPPPILDPFAGGGTIPLEAQRLGLEAHASDLNPVAVLINKALIEIPPKFTGEPPVSPGLAESRLGRWDGASGLAADVRAYGEQIRDEAFKQIGDHYPEATLASGLPASVVAWIWARTVLCPNPVCRRETPLVNSFVVCNKRNKRVVLMPSIVGGSLRFEVTSEGVAPPPTVGRTGGVCLFCSSSISLADIRKQGMETGLGRTLLCTVAEGSAGREYLAADRVQLQAASVKPANDFPDIPLPDRALGFRVQIYGLSSHRDLYTARQQLALLKFAELARNVHQRVLDDGASSEYAVAIKTYLALLLGRLANRSSSQSFWDAGGENVQQVFARNALPMVWVYAEANPFSHSSGNALGQLDYLCKALEGVPARGIGDAVQRDAIDLPPGRFVFSTDPPYYDNVPYADLSDFFYLWHRLVLRDDFPELYETVKTPKGEELIAEPARHASANDAKKFFEDGLRSFFNGVLAHQNEEFPFAVYYAFKQSESAEDGTASTGWETMLQGLVDSGSEVVATWPVRTELAGGLRELGRNALASSVVLAARQRTSSAISTDRRGFIAALQAELPEALRNLQQGAIAPVDLPQAAIGPGMGVFSRYSRVVEDDGTPMSVRSALARINEILDQVLTEQEGDFDAHTRFAVTWYKQHGYVAGKFGDANGIAQARNTSIDALVRAGIVTSAAGKAALIAPADLPVEYDVLTDDSVSEWEVLQHLIGKLEREGLAAAGKFIAEVRARQEDAIDLDLVKELAYMLFADAEANGFTQDAIAFNTVATSWPEMLDASRNQTISASGQQTSLEI